ncbi:MAG: hypothetical protein IPL95_18270 [Saprospiraceae bacterium]|nr:hypothetical protein [Saprospiraceae bacterium]
MGCSGCSVSSDLGKGCGCGSGGCSSGGCNRLNTFDWLTTLDIEDASDFELVEVSFRNGSRKEFFRNLPNSRATTGDYVMLEAENGFDIGKISLSGELARLQIKKKSIKEDALFRNVIRKANERDLEKLQDIRSMEKPTMIQARAIAKTLNIDMKIGDVEYQGDGRKATFYYTAEGRIDFRELIRHFAKDFKVKIEMRQIGVRQESAKIGGIGSCGRELCCSTWLTDFKSVSTIAARYQNLAINQAKLSGQCGRLKCCLNYELDVYMEALEQFPQNAERIRTAGGMATLVKTDIFKGLLFYGYENDKSNKTYPLEPIQVRSMQEMLSRGQMPPELSQMQIVAEDLEKEVGYEDVTGAVELPDEKKKKKKKKKKPNSGEPRENRNEPRNNEKPQPPRENAPNEVVPNNQGGNKGEQQNRVDRQNRPEHQNRPDQPQNKGEHPQKKWEKKPFNPNKERNFDRNVDQNKGERSENAKPNTDQEKPINPNPPQNPPQQKEQRAEGDIQPPNSDQPNNGGFKKPFKKKFKKFPPKNNNNPNNNNSQ